MAGPLDPTMADQLAAYRSANGVDPSSITTLQAIAAQQQAPPPAPAPPDTSVGPPLSPQQAAVLSGQPVPPPAPVGGPQVARPGALGVQDAAAVNVAKRAGEVGYTPPPGAGAPGAVAIPMPRVIGMTKAGFQPGSRSTTTVEGVKFSPETQAALDEAQDASQQIAELTPKVAAEQAQYDATYHQTKANVEQAQQAADFVRRARAQSELNRQWTTLQQAQQEAKEASNIDPNRYYKNRTTVGHIADAVALIAGGMLAGLNGGPNEAVAAIRQRVDADIEAQRDAYAGKKAAAEHAQTLYGQLRQKGLDEEQSATGAKIMALQQLDDQLAATKPTDQIGRLSVQQARLKTAQDLAKLRGEFDEKSSARVQSSLSETYKPAQAITAGGDLYKRYQAYVEGQLAKPGGVAMTYPEFARAVGGAGGASLAGSAAGGQPKAPDIPEAPSSVRFSLGARLGVHGTEGFAQKEQQDHYNSAVRANILASGASPRAVENLAQHYLVQPGDTDEEIKKKRADFVKDYGPGSGTSLKGKGAQGGDAEEGP